MEKLLKIIGSVALIGALLMAGGCGGGGDAPVVTNPSATAPIAATVNPDGTATTGATPTNAAPAAGTTGYLANVSATIPPNTVITAKNADGSVKALTAAPSVTFTAPADASATASGTDGVPVPTGFTTLSSTSGALDVQITGAASATFSSPITITMPVPGKAVGSIVVVYTVTGTTYTFLGSFTVTTPGFVSFPVSSLSWKVADPNPDPNSSPTTVPTTAPTTTVLPTTVPTTSTTTVPTTAPTTSTTTALTSVPTTSSTTTALPTTAPTTSTTTALTTTIPTTSPTTAPTTIPTTSTTTALTSVPTTSTTTTALTTTIPTTSTTTVATTIPTTSTTTVLTTIPTTSTTSTTTVLTTSTTTSTTTVAAQNCTLCHGIPPTTGLAAGEHSLHANRGISCSTCHGTGYSNNTVGETPHPSGVKNVVSGSTVGWNPTARSCNPSCHGNENW